MNSNFDGIARVQPLAVGTSSGSLILARENCSALELALVA